MNGLREDGEPEPVFVDISEQDKEPSPVFTANHRFFVIRKHRPLIDHLIDVSS